MQSCFPLYGSEPREGHGLRYNAMRWGWPGSAVSASTVRLNFNYWPVIDEAEIEIVWYPYDRAYIQLFVCDYVNDGQPVNRVSFPQLHSPANWNPVPLRDNLTNWMQQFIGTGVKYFCYNVHGNITLLSVRLYLAYVALKAS